LYVGACGAGAQGGVGEDRAAVGVEHHVFGLDRAVGQAGVVEVGQGLGEWDEERDQLAASQWSAAGEERGEAACSQALSDEDPTAVGCA
jgi:hypothetical protein